MAEARVPDRTGPWERRFERTVEVLPFALLALSTILTLVQPDQSARDRLAVVALAALATAWVRGHVHPALAAVAGPHRPDARLLRRAAGPGHRAHDGLLVLPGLRGRRAGGALLPAPGGARLPRGVRHLTADLHRPGRVPGADRGRGHRLGVHRRAPDGPERLLRPGRGEDDGGRPTP